MVCKLDKNDSRAAAIELGVFAFGDGKRCEEGNGRSWRTSLSCPSCCGGSIWTAGRLGDFSHFQQIHLFLFQYEPYPQSAVL